VNKLNNVKVNYLKIPKKHRGRQKNAHVFETPDPTQRNKIKQDHTSLFSNWLNWPITAC